MCIFKSFIVSFKVVILLDLCKYCRSILVNVWLCDTTCCFTKTSPLYISSLNLSCASQPHLLARTSFLLSFFHSFSLIFIPVTSSLEQTKHRSCATPSIFLTVKFRKLNPVALAWPWYNNSNYFQLLALIPSNGSVVSNSLFLVKQSDCKHSISLVIFEKKIIERIE